MRRSPQDVIFRIANVLKNGRNGDEYSVAELVKETNMHYMTVSNYLTMIEYVHTNIPKFVKEDGTGKAKITITRETETEFSGIEKYLLQMFDEGAFGRNTAILSEPFDEILLEEMIGNADVIRMGLQVYLSKKGIMKATELVDKRFEKIMRMPVETYSEMNFDNIAEFNILRRESQDEEWKESWRSENLATLSAFAGGNGGRMIIGRSDNGTIVGVPDAKHLLKMIPDLVHNKLDFIPIVNLMLLDGKECIEIIVEKQDHYPSFDQKFYSRSGSTTREVRGRKLKRLLMKDLGIIYTDEIAEKVKLDDISVDAVKEFIKRGEDCGRIPKGSSEDTLEETLRKLKLMDENSITIGGALLFHKDPRSICLDAVIKIGLFSNKGGMPLMDDVIDGPIIRMPEAASKMLHLRYVQPRYDVEGVYRVMKYRYPPKALREALLNAVIHREYYQDGEITVRVYEDRIEIYNPGHLPDGWNVDDLLQKHDSDSPNKNMANVFYCADLIERWGVGIETMREECRKNGNPDPEFHIEEDGIRVIFRSGSWPYDGNVIQMPAEPDGLTSSDIEIYRAIVRGKYTTAEDMATSIGSSVKTVRRSTDKLREMNLIRRAGNHRKGAWEPNTGPTN